MTFGNFAEAVLHAAGVPIRPMTRLMKRELVRQIIAEQSSRGRLGHFQSIAKTAGLVDLVCEFISELKRLEIWPDDFRRACAGPRTGRQGRRTVGNLRRLSATRCGSTACSTPKGGSGRPATCWRGRGERGEGRGEMGRQQCNETDSRKGRAGTDPLSNPRSPVPSPLSLSLLLSPLSSHRRRRLHRLHANAARDSRDLWRAGRGDVRHAAAGGRAAAGRSVRQAAEDARRTSPAASRRDGRAIGQADRARVAGDRATWSERFSRIRGSETRDSGERPVAERSASGTSVPRRSDPSPAPRPRPPSLSHRNPRRRPAGGRNRDDRRGGSSGCWSMARRGRARSPSSSARRKIPASWSMRCSAGWAFPSCSESGQTLDRSPALRFLVALLQLDLDDWPFDRLLAVLGSNYFQPDWPEWRDAERAAVERAIRAAANPPRPRALIEQLATCGGDSLADRRRRRLATADRMAIVSVWPPRSMPCPQRATLPEWGKAWRRLAAETGLLRAMTETKSGRCGDGRQGTETRDWHTELSVSPSPPLPLPLLPSTAAPGTG